MTKYRIMWMPESGKYIAQAKVLFGWISFGDVGPHGADYDYEFETQQDALEFIDSLNKPRPSTKPVVVWEGER